MNILEKYIKRCIDLAKNGLGTTYPNPLVGCVIVYNNTIIGEGWHRKAGEHHAEVNAIEAVADKSLLLEATLYVNLEPCSHQGKTPPCCELIVEHQIPKVVVGTVDSNKKVAGRGISHLKSNGCNVSVGVLEDACKELNKRFFTFHEKRRPYVILKWAESADGFMDKERGPETPVGPQWITTESTRQLVHKMRTEEQSILVGTTTVLHDDPSLTARMWVGNSPVRVVIDKTLKISKTARVFDSESPTIIITERKTGHAETADLVCKFVDFSKNVPMQIVQVLYEAGISSVIVEGGTNTIEGFINDNLWDEAFVFKGVVEFKKGKKAPVLNSTALVITEFGDDTLSVYRNSK